MKYRIRSNGCLYCKDGDTAERPATEAEVKAFLKANKEYAETVKAEPPAETESVSGAE